MCHKFIRLVAITSLIGLFSAFGCGGDETGQSERNYGTITGNVTLEDAGDFSGVIVEAGDRSATTDAEGSYQLERLSPGTIEVTASFEGYVSQTQSADVAADETVTLDFNLQFENQPPVIESVIVDPSVLVPTETASVVVVAHDPDGSELVFSYEATEGFVVEAGAEHGEAMLTAPDEFGVDGEFRVTVEDAAGLSTSETVSVQTRSNADPVIESISAVPGQFEPGQTGVLTVTASDPDGDELQYQWDAPEGWSLNPSDEATIEATAPDEPDNTALVEVTVTDGLGGMTKGDVTVTTRDNRAPVITALDVEPPQVAPGEEIQLSVEAHDPDGDDLSYDWSAPVEWTVVDSQNPTTNLVAPEQYGVTAFIEVMVTDEYGASATAEVVVSTITNQGPQISSITADPTQVERGGIASLEVLASHPQNADLEYDWDAPAEWTLIEDLDQPQSPQLEAPNTPGESATVMVTVTDPGGLEAVASVMVSTFANQTPVIESFSADPSSVIPGETVSLEVSAYDPDGFELTYEWDIPAEWTGSSDTDVVTLTAPDTYGVSGTVSVTVSDGIDTRLASVSVSTVQNIAPTISSFTADPLFIERGGTSMLQVVASDPYGDPLSYSWELDNDAWMLSGSGDEVTLEAPDIPGDSVTVTVTVDDGHGGLTDASVMVAIMPNSAPVIFEFDADPSTVARSGVSILSVTAYDPDGEPLSYTWSVDNDDWSIVGSGDEVNLEAPNTPSDEVTVTVTVDDGFGGMASDELTVETEANQAPVIASLTSDPADWILQGGSADLTVDASDPDGDTLSYDWSAPVGWTIVGDGAEVALEAPDENRADATIAVTVSDIWGATDEAEIDVRTQDTEPDPFGFEEQDEVGPNTPITSNEVVIEGFDGPLTAECSDCEVSRNGGAFAASVGDFYPGDTIEIRVLSGDLEETVTAAVTLGDTTSSEWSVTTTNWEGIRDFSTCSQSGRTGPTQSQCDGEYSGTVLNDEVAVESGIQLWTVPVTGTYRIETWGAEGGVANQPGKGARMRGDFELEAGDTLLVLVGQQGSSISSGGAGGGGGSFVVLQDGDEPLIVAGGGMGGNNHTSGSYNHSDGGRTTNTGPHGGPVGYSTDVSGGGGFEGNGEGSAGGQSFLNGGLGGIGGGQGGFGGGGGKNGSTLNGGCGGGGYTGGAGNNSDGNHSGGGSFNDGASQDSEADINEGHGRVTIDLLS